MRFDELPPEIIQHIASFLDYPSHIALARCSHALYAVLDPVQRRAKDIKKLCGIIHSVLHPLGRCILVGSSTLWLHSLSRGMRCQWSPGDIDVAVPGVRAGETAEQAIPRIEGVLSTLPRVLRKRWGRADILEGDAWHDTITEGEVEHVTYAKYKIDLPCSFLRHIHLFMYTNADTLVEAFDFSALRIWMPLDTLVPRILCPADTDAAVYARQLYWGRCPCWHRIRHKETRIVKYVSRGYRLAGVHALDGCLHCRERKGEPHGIDFE